MAGATAASMGSFLGEFLGTVGDIAEAVLKSLTETVIYEVTWTTRDVPRTMRKQRTEATTVQHHVKITMMHLFIVYVIGRIRGWWGPLSTWGDSSNWTRMMRMAWLVPGLGAVGTVGTAYDTAMAAWSAGSEGWTPTPEQVAAADITGHKS